MFCSLLFLHLSIQIGTICQTTATDGSQEAEMIICAVRSVIQALRENNVKNTKGWLLGITAWRMSQRDGKLIRCFSVALHLTHQGCSAAALCPCLTLQRERESKSQPERQIRQKPKVRDWNTERSGVRGWQKYWKSKQDVLLWIRKGDRAAEAHLHLHIIS